MTDAFIGIDIGTSGCRTVAIDQFGQILTEQTYSYDRPQFKVAANGKAHAEQDPQWLWATVVKLLKQLVATCQSTVTIQAIAVDATSGSILLTDKYGQPLSPIILYNDNRAWRQSKRIAEIAPDTSAAHGTASGLSKLSYLQETLSLPNQYHLLHQADWINFKLGAPLGISDENNALKTGYDPVAQQWPAWLTPFRGKATLPKVVAAGTKIGQLSETVAKQLGIKNQPSIVAGTTDSIAAFLATDAHKIGDAVTSLGSSLVIKQLSDKPVFKPEQGIYSHRLGNKWLVGGASNTGGAVLKFFFTDLQLTELSEQIDIDAPCYDYYPILTPGERFPVNDPNLQPRLSPRPQNDVLFLHSLLTSMAKIEQQAYRSLQTAGTTAVKSVRTVGGGSNNRIWQAIRQQFLAVPFITPRYTEAAYGVAQLARSALKNNQ